MFLIPYKFLLCIFIILFYYIYMLIYYSEDTVYQELCLLIMFLPLDPHKVVGKSLASLISSPFLEEAKSCGVG